MKKEKTMKLTLPDEELMSPGHLACQGCGATMAMRYVLKALGQKTVLCIPACCWAVIDGPFPHSSLERARSSTAPSRRPPPRPPASRPAWR